MQEWNIPVDLLCFHSSYFKSKLQGKFAEAKNKRVELLREKPEAFGLVVEWLYTHGLKVSSRNEKANTDMYCEELGFGTLLDTWTLADKLDLPELQNIIMKIMDKRVTYHQLIPIAEVAILYEDYEPTKLSQWILYSCVWVVSQDMDTIGCFTKGSELELLKDILKEVLLYGPAKKKFVLDDDYLVPE